MFIYVEGIPGNGALGDGSRASPSPEDSLDFGVKSYRYSREKENDDAFWKGDVVSMLKTPLLIAVLPVRHGERG